MGVDASLSDVIRTAWTNASKIAKAQFFVIAFLLIVVPVSVSAVFSQQLYKPRASSIENIVTPPILVTPSPKPVKTCNEEPTISIIPAIQSAKAGTAVNYKIFVTNNNSIGCLKVAFNLLKGPLLNGWKGQLSNTILTLDSQGTGNAQIVFTSPINAVAKDYSVSVYLSGFKGNAVATYRVTNSNSKETPISYPKSPLPLY